MAAGEPSKRTSMITEKAKQIISKQKPDKLVHLKVMDLTVRNGLRFGFGLSCGMYAFTIAMDILKFIMAFIRIGLEMGGI